jgi:hypothetical protein
VDPLRLLSYLQEPTPCPYPEPNKFSPHTHTLLLKFNFNIILPSMLMNIKLPLSIQGFGPILYMRFSSLPSVPDAAPISLFDLFTLIINNWWRVHIMEYTLCNFLYTAITSSAGGLSTFVWFQFWWEYFRTYITVNAYNSEHGWSLQIHVGGRGRLRSDSTYGEVIQIFAWVLSDVKLLYFGSGSSAC